MHNTQTKRHPHHPTDACAVAADRATVFVEVAGREPMRSNRHSWLEMVEGLANGLSDLIEDIYPDVPFDADHDLGIAAALAYAVGAVCRDAVEGSGDDYEPRMARGLNAVLTIVAELERVAKRLDGESEGSNGKPSEGNRDADQPGSLVDARLAIRGRMEGVWKALNSAKTERDYKVVADSLRETGAALRARGEDLESPEPDAGVSALYQSCGSMALLAAAALEISGNQPDEEAVDAIRWTVHSATYDMTHTDYSTVEV